jgi:hypothetical protein
MELEAVPAGALPEGAWLWMAASASRRVSSPAAVSPSRSLVVVTT